MAIFGGALLRLGMGRLADVVSVRTAFLVPLACLRLSRAPRGELVPARSALRSLMRHDDDPRTVLTLDAGGTELVFSAMRGSRPVVQPVSLPTATAIANAIHHATGVRITATPMTPVRLCAALAGRKQEG